MRGIDGIIYINLDHRTDRKKLIESELHRIGVPNEKVHRFSAVYDRFNGTKGCLLSHIQALDLAIEKRWERVLILEDDVVFIKKQKEIENQLAYFFEVTNGEWDVFFLGGGYREKKPLLGKRFFRSIIHGVPTLISFIVPISKSLKPAFFLPMK